MKNVVIDLSILGQQKRTGLHRYSACVTRELIRRGKYNYSYIMAPEVTLRELRGTKKIPVSILNNHTIEAQKELAFWTREAKGDLLMTTYFPAPERKTFKTILTIHDLIPLKLPELYKGFQPYDFCEALRKNAPYADAIIAVSHSAKRDIMELFGIPASKIFVITEAADNAFKPIRSSGRKDPLWPTFQKKYNLQTPYILSLCTFSLHKNLSRTLEAFARVKNDKKNKFASGLKLVLAGMAGSAEQMLSKALKEHPFAADIIHTGYLEDKFLPTVYAHAEAFVAPSLYEGFGLPMLEAMQSGVTVVTANNSSIPEVCGEAAFYCQATNVESIAEAISRALTQEDERREKIALGLERAKLFSWKKTAEQVEAVIDKLL
jgi:glycosyltransferase involved in cell wall biosynthesis